MEAARRLQIKSPDPSRASTPIQLPDTTGQHIMQVIRDSTPDGLTTPRYTLTPSPNVTTRPDNTSILSAGKKNEAADLINLESARSSPILPQKSSSIPDENSSLESLDKLIDNVPTRFSDSNSIDDEQMIRDSLLTSPTSSDDNIINTIDQPDFESFGKNVTFSFEELPEETKRNVTPNLGVLKNVGKKTPIIEITEAENEVFGKTEAISLAAEEVHVDSKSATLIETADIEKRTPSPSLKELKSSRSTSSSPEESKEEQKEEIEFSESVLPEQKPKHISLASDEDQSPTQVQTEVEVQEEKSSTDVSIESKVVENVSFLQDKEEISTPQKLSAKIETEEKTRLPSPEPQKLDLPSSSQEMLVEDGKQPSDKSPLASRNIHRVGDYGRRQPKTGWL